MPMRNVSDTDSYYSSPVLGVHITVADWQAVDAMCIRYQVSIRVRRVYHPDEETAAAHHHQRSSSRID